MDPQHFPYDRFLALKEDKERRLVEFMTAPAMDDIPVVIRPPCNVWGAVSRYREQSLDLQLDALALSLQMQSDFLFSYLEPWHGMGVFANIFGCPVNWNDYDAPQTRYLYHSVDELRDLKRPHVMDSELAQMVLETIRYFRRVTGDALDISLTDTQSPNDSASLILDTCEFFAAGLAEPEQITPFMEMVTDVMIEFSDMQFDAMGPTATHPGHIMLSARQLPGISISDDNMAVISRATYHNSALPYNNRLSEHFGGIAIHTCGNFMQNYAIVKQMSHLLLIDCAVAGTDPQPNDAAKLNAAFAGTGIIIKARIGEDEANWQVLDDLVSPDLKLILQVESDGDITRSNRTYEKLKTRCRDILASKSA
jgi:Uroporphyrinogen decarboxylase (URO-D)